MTKRWIKIIILFILIIIIIIGGWFMYSSIDYNKRSYSTNIFDRVPSDAIEVFNINKESRLNELSVYDTLYEDYAKLLPDEFSSPFILCKDSNENIILLAKMRKDEEAKIKEHIEKNISLSYKPVTKTYSGTELSLYPLANDHFLVCSFDQGIFAASRRLKLIEKYIDTDSTRLFFADVHNDNIFHKKILNSPIGMFVKEDNDILAFDFRAENDTIILNGYIGPTDSTKNELIPYKMKIPKNLCIDKYEISVENKTAAIQIILNKMY